MTEEYERYKYEQALRYLNHVKGLGDRINAKQEAIEDYRGKLTCVRGMDYSAGGVRIQGAGDAIPEGVAELLAMIDECADMMAEYAREQRRAMRTFGRLSRCEYEQLLEKHYLRGKSWSAVAREMGYSYDHVMRMRRLAIIEVHGLMPPEWSEIPKAI